MSAHRERPFDFPRKGPFPLVGVSAIDRCAIWIATACGVGYAPKAPGTFGSVPGIGLGVFLQSTWGEAPAMIVGSLVIATLLAAWSIDRTERALHIHDDGRIVIDEVVGQAIATAFIPVEWLWIGVSFGLFRLLDITKPSLIGWIDAKAPGTLGTLGDDVLAGIVAAIGLIVAREALIYL